MRECGTGKSDVPINARDGNGLFWNLAISAGLGAGANAYTNNSDWKSGKISGWDYAKTIGIGAASGLARGVLGAGGAALVNSVLKGAVANAFASAANEAGQQAVKHGEVNDLEQGRAAMSVGAVKR